MKNICRLIILLLGSSLLANAQTKATKKAATTSLVAISNTDDKTIEVYDYHDTVWNASTRKWLFKPTPAQGFSADAVEALGDGVGDMRIHQTNGFPDKATTVMAVQGGRFLGLAVYEPKKGYTKGQKLWELIYPKDQNPNDHAVELLPNGNIAAAGFGMTPKTAFGNWIRIYNTSTADTSQYAEIQLTGAHALHYDSNLKRLWAGGEIKINGHIMQGIFAYIIGGTREKPTITEDVSLRGVLPFGDPTVSPANTLKWPHDITADYDDYNKLIYGDHTGIYSYDKKAKTFTATPGASHLYHYDGIDIAVKSASKQPNGGLLMITSIKGVDAKAHPFETNSVDFYDPITGKLVFSRFVSGFSIYRARIWTTVYQ